MLLTDPGSLPFWRVFTRLGEAQILLPAAALTMLALVRERQGRILAGRWLAALGAAMALTTVSKLAFIGWGIGWAALDFTGISGHAMFAAAVYPLLLGALMPPAPRFAPWLAVSAGAALALLVGVSRVAVQAHSWSEVTAGLTLGGAVSVIALAREGLAACQVPPWVPLVTAAWLSLTPVHASASHSHALVTRMALALSGRHMPYTRDDLRRGKPGMPEELSSNAAVESIRPAPSAGG
jgi:membrane-associated phospholipid phosphatase